MFQITSGAVTVMGLGEGIPQMTSGATMMWMKKPPLCRWYDHPWQGRWESSVVVLQEFIKVTNIPQRTPPLLNKLPWQDWAIIGINTLLLLHRKERRPQVIVGNVVGVGPLLLRRSSHR
jgi:hypothetical protein